MSDYTVKEWVDHIWQSETNTEYRSRLSACPLIVNLTSFLQEPKTLE